ncbi:hypothetical protein UlMin_037117 [Ulmus minor]
MSDPNIDRNQTNEPSPPLPQHSSSPTTTMASTSTSSTSGKRPRFRGIRCRSGKWVSEIREPKKTTRIWLGTYPTAEMAAAAYDVAALALKGSEAILNFPSSVGEYPVPGSASAADIRSAAAAAAASRRPEVRAAGGETTSFRNEVMESNTTTYGGEYVDEEDLFRMPNLLVEMAEGMLLSPPRIESPPSDYSPGSSDGDTLWSYFP